MKTNTKKVNRSSASGKFVDAQTAQEQPAEVYSDTVPTKQAKPSVAEAVNTLQNELRTDKGFYHVYQSNIAMAFVDEAAKYHAGGVYDFQKIGNDAATRFMELWLNQPTKD